MEIEINKEIRNYSESIFFGLNMRQCIFSGLAVGFSILLYFILSPFMPAAAWSLICIFVSSPIAAIGFVKYNGLPAEQFIVLFLRYLFAPKHIVFVTEQKTRRKQKHENTKTNTQGR